MGARVWAGVTLALAASLTVVVAGQDPETLKEGSGTTIAIKGCIARAASSSGSQASEVRGTTSVGHFILAKAEPAMAMGGTADKPAGDRMKLPNAKEYTLRGSDSMLGPYVDHHVELTGFIEAPAAGARNASGGPAPTLMVESVQMLASSCM